MHRFLRALPFLLLGAPLPAMAATQAAIAPAWQAQAQRVTITRDDKTGQTPFSTGADSPTCLTTLRLT